MIESETYDLIIIGGGLAGLCCALHLSKKNIKILLIEKYQYPHHKVCGEYVSNEVAPYLRSLGVDPFSEGAVAISKFEISSKEGKTVSSNLPLGGFGISRYALDHLLYQKVKERVTVAFSTVEMVSFSSEIFTVRTLLKDTFKARFVVGAFGKRSLLDTMLHRPFSKQKSPWLAVKAHYKYDFPDNKVALHNFEGGYCGVSRVESGMVNACYLTTYKSFKAFGGIETFQKEQMSQNPHLDCFFKEAELLWEKPLSISQISFDQKEVVDHHIFMIGDSAGLIHPLCGNGMAMAIHSAKIFSELFIEFSEKKEMTRVALEMAYKAKWQETFYRRLQTGRIIQNLLLRPITAHMGLKVAQLFPSLLPKVIKKTHGDLLV